MRKTWPDLTAAIIVAAIAAAVPFAGLSRYTIGELLLMLVYATVASQWNLLFGVAGVFSLAQMAVFALGGYATAMLGSYLHWSLWLAMPMAGVASVLFSVLIGLACLRLSGAYVALLTLAVAQVMYLLIVTDTACFRMAGTTCMQFTGGAVGFTDFGSLGTRALFHGQWIAADYALVAMLFALTMAFTYVVMHSPIGLAFRALRDNPGYARARGVNQFRMQLLVFALSAFFTGLAGGLYAAHFESVGPSALSLSQLLFIIAMVVVGGIGRFWGPLLGAVLLTAADELMRGADQFRLLGLGLIIAAAMVVLPQGVLGALDQARTRLFQPKRPEARAAAAGE